MQLEYPAKNATCCHCSSTTLVKIFAPIRASISMLVLKSVCRWIIRWQRQSPLENLIKRILGLDARFCANILCFTMGFLLYFRPLFITLCGTGAELGVCEKRSRWAPNPSNFSSIFPSTAIELWTKRLKAGFSQLLYALLGSSYTGARRQKPTLWLRWGVVVVVEFMARGTLKLKLKQNQEEKEVCDLFYKSCKGNSRGANAHTSLTKQSWKIGCRAATLVKVERFNLMAFWFHLNMKWTVETTPIFKRVLQRGYIQKVMTSKVMKNGLHKGESISILIQISPLPVKTDYLSLGLKVDFWGIVRPKALTTSVLHKRKVGEKNWGFWPFLKSIIKLTTLPWVNHIIIKKTFFFKSFWIMNVFVPGPKQARQSFYWSLRFKREISEVTIWWPQAIKYCLQNYTDWAISSVVLVHELFMNISNSNDRYNCVNDALPNISNCCVSIKWKTRVLPAFCLWPNKVWKKESL